jgi:uridylate kinase
VESVNKRVVLKISGEALMGEKDCCINPPTLEAIAEGLIAAKDSGCQIATVIGGGNIFRGLSNATECLHRATGDYMGMLATLINALALQDCLICKGHEPALFSAFEVAGVAAQYERRTALRAFGEGKILILAAGTGRPFFTTDTAAVMRALELDCDAILKASHVDGIYDSDPYKNPNAKRYEELTFADAIDKRLKVVDMTALSLCWENNLPLIVFDLRVPGNIQKVLAGDTSVGTIVK